MWAKDFGSAGPSGLLHLEKKRRALPPRRLCFVSIADLAKYCGARARIRNESSYFQAYLIDGSMCAAQLGLVTSRPTLRSDWLPLVAQPSFEDRSRLFAQETESRSVPDRPTGISVIDRLGRWHRITPAFVKAYRAGRMELGSTPFERGQFDELLIAEKYGTFRWHFDWRHYVVVGVPDGITDDFVYEFKSTKHVGRMKLVAERQADLYGYFFGREHKRIQIRDVSTGRVRTFSSRVDRARAERILAQMLG